jgi:hypothetical protein
MPHSATPGSRFIGCGVGKSTVVAFDSARVGTYRRDY